MLTCNDDERFVRYSEYTGIPIRARKPDGSFVTVDIGQLDRDSLVKWLLDGKGDGQRAASVVLMILGHSDWRVRDEELPNRDEIEIAVDWIINDARYKAPEVIGPVAQRWLDRLLEACGCEEDRRD